MKERERESKRNWIEPVLELVIVFHSLFSLLLPFEPFYVSTLILLFLSFSLSFFLFHLSFSVNVKEKERSITLLDLSSIRSFFFFLSDSFIARKKKSYKGKNFGQEECSRTSNTAKRTLFFVVSFLFHSSFFLSISYFSPFFLLSFFLLIFSLFSSFLFLSLLELNIQN